MKSRSDQVTEINRANQLNPYHSTYWKSRGQSMPPIQYIPGLVCANKIKSSDNKANQLNRNKGTDGTNRHYDQAQGNRGNQMNPNQQGTSSSRTKH